MEKIRFECRKHLLEYEYPADWPEVQGMTPPACPLCKAEDNAEISAKYVEVKRQRDKLLEAIEVKLNVKVEE